MVRQAQALGSTALKERLATGSIIDEVTLVNDRLHYRLVTGSGPGQGWVSLQVSGKDLVVRHHGEERQRKQAQPDKPPQTEKRVTSSKEAPEVQRRTGASDVRGTTRSAADDSLRKRIEAEARAKARNGDFLRYCLKYKILGYPLPDCKLRILCLHSAGGAESAYTSPGTPLLSWVKEAKNVELCALDFPGRNRLLKAERHTSIDTLAPDLLGAVFDKLADGVPYVVWAHSVGAWVAFELLLLARRAGLPMPRAGLFMAFPAPHLPEPERPWRRSAGLDDEELREELMCWDAEHFQGPGGTVFELGWAGTWEPMLRADFRLFDEYEFRHAGAPRFDFPIHAWHFEREQRCRPEMISMWRDWTSAGFDHRVMEGMGHLTCFYEPELKRRYFERVTEVLRGYASQVAGAAA